MNTAEKLSTRQSAKYQTVNGVTYFKLKSEFDGDYTKNCGLLGEEIDQNFYFLRGYDIKSIELNDDRQLVITRVDSDYAPIIVDLAEELTRPTFAYDDTTGIITITYPGEEPIEIGGFLVEGRDIRMASDGTLKGNGTMYKPLGISEVEKTGTYAPADEYFDITADNIMPATKSNNEAFGSGYRIVTKETINTFGLLYPFDAVLKIDEKLKELGSQWRVPSKDDWDELLNALEPCEEYRNHDSLMRGYFGRYAGAGMKSTNLWDTFETGPTEDPVNGQDIVGLSVLPVGACEQHSRFTARADSGETEGFKEYTNFWTKTPSASMGFYTKAFSYDLANVAQDVSNPNAKYSIRLVKDYAYNNFNDVENILGVPHTCKLVHSPYEDCDYIKIWTSVNVGFTDGELSGITSYEWSAATESDMGKKEVYFINEWNGVEWVKKVLGEGDSVVIKDYEGGAPYHEWRIINGELVDTVAAIMDEFSDELGSIDERITSLEGRQDVDEQRLDSLENRQNVDEQRLDMIEPRVDALEERQNAGEERLSNAETRIDNLEGRQNVDETRLDNLEGRQNVDETRLDNLEGRQNVDEQRLDALEPRVDNLENRQDIDETRLNNLEDRQDVDETRLDNLEGRQNIDEQRLDALEPRVDNLESGLAAEIENRIANDITPGDYEIKANESVVIPTNGEDVADLSIKIADDFFDFGSF